MCGDGAADRTRTYYPIITNDVLYLMSYSGVKVFYSANSCPSSPFDVNPLHLRFALA